MAEWESLTPTQQNVYQIVNITDDEQVINLGVYLRKVQTMPLAEDCPSEFVLYVGSTNASYIRGCIYRSTPSVVSGETVYNWVAQQVQADYAQNDSSAVDYIKNKPTLGTASAKDYTDNVRPNNFNLVESHAVYSAINSALSSIYVPRGELSCAELTSDLLIPANVGNVYMMSDSGVTTSLFINGAGHVINTNDNVGIIRAGADSIMFNLMGNAFDLHEYQTKELETPLTIDGVEQTEVEGALGALNTEIDNIGTNKVDWEYEEWQGVKNIFPYPYLQTTVTHHGVTFTDNGDGTISINGITDDTQAQIDLASRNYADWFRLREGSYILSDGLLNVTATNVEKVHIYLRIYDNSTSTLIRTISTQSSAREVKFDISAEEAANLKSGAWGIASRLYVSGIDVEINNILVKPMLCDAVYENNLNWVAYAKSNSTLTTDVQPFVQVPIRKGTGTKSIIGNEISDNTASGLRASAFGYRTQANGTNSFANGVYTQANGERSVVSGYYTTANGAMQTVLGKYNVAQGDSSTTTVQNTDYALIVGNGANNSNRSNALALQWDGTVVFQDGTTQKTSPYKLIGELGAKNLIPYPYFHVFPREINGITFSSIGDNNGGFNINGELTEGQTYSYIQLAKLNSWQAGDYIAYLNSNSDIGDALFFEIRMDEVGSNTHITIIDISSHTNTAQFNVTDAQAELINGIDYTLGLYVIVNNKQGSIIDNIDVYPMICYASDTDPTWQPYAKTNYELTNYLNDLPIKNGSGSRSIVANYISTNVASGVNAWAEGDHATASGYSSHAEGSYTQATQSFAHAEGLSAIASGTKAHAEGYQTTASGESSHAEGGNTTASGQFTHAEGSWSQSIGNNSHAEGQGCYAYGLTSHAQNDHTIARGEYQTTLGRYNVEQGVSTGHTDTDYALIIGNGTDGSHRSNALAVQWDGTVVMQDNSTMKSAKTVYEVMGKMGAKNLISYPSYVDGDSKEYAGVVFTTNTDGSIVANGTSDAYSFYILKRKENLLPHGDYILSFNNADMVSDNISCSIGITNKTTYVYTTKASVNKNSNNVAFTIDDTWDNNFIELRLSVSQSGVIIDNLTIYPIIRLADDQDDTWQPYAMTNKQLTDKVNDIDTTLDTKLDKISSLPTPSSTYLNQTYLLTSTQAGYQKGGIYQCVSDGQPTPTYSWSLISSADMVEFTAQELLAMW